MARRRPELRNWDGSYLAKLDSTSPREWVETVLTDAYQIRRPRSWTYGEIREAIRRELERRGGVTNPANVAHVRTQRGLAALRRDNLIQRSGLKYRFPKRHRYAEMIAGLARLAARSRAPLRVEYDYEHLPDDRHAATLSVTFGGGGWPVISLKLREYAEIE